MQLVNLSNISSGCLSISNYSFKGLSFAFSSGYSLPLAPNINSSSSRQNYELFTTIPEPAFFRQFHQKLFFYCINSKALLICTFWRWKSLLRDPSPSFFCFLFLLSLTHTHTFTLGKQKTVRVYPTGLGKGHRGQTSWARLLPDIMVELSVTPPHTVSA